MYYAIGVSAPSFRKRMKICVAIDERKRIQHFDQQFKKKSLNRFKPPSKRRQQGLSLLINQQVTSDPHTILSTWGEHFTKLSATNEEEFPAISSMKERVKQLMTASFKNDDSLLDVPFCAVEVDAILRKLKPGRHDMLQAEHLKYGGPILHEWIRPICNSDLEHVPDSLKMGIVIPVYKGGGKDPLDTNSYRGITLTSVIAKVLESLVLARLRDHLTERGIPHPNQTAYRKRVLVLKPSSPHSRLSLSIPKRMKRCTCAFTTSRKLLIPSSILYSSRVYMKLESMARPGG